MADTLPLKTAYLLDENGNNLYAWSHTQRVRYNDTKTLDNVLAEMLASINKKIETKAQIIASLGYTPVNPGSPVAFTDTVMIKKELQIGGAIIKPLLDGTTEIGFIIE